ncbi:M1 family metallopeptidase [Geothrix sp. 21YS21S-4]|uniref:M1 family metallopeptidase n=1 Tax=Geothrix sp. 21YS21S-4 TaxID=3068889 RepID=UPI0027B90B78|nr:M1 family aminopeptidase [Geothrix sp. 21YS21S-4]
MEAAPQDLSRRVALYSERPTLGEAVNVKNWDLPVGRMTLSMASGTLAPLMNQGRVLGFHFKGKGSFRYRSEEPLERAVFSSNHKHHLAKNASKAILGDVNGQQILTEELQSFTLWQAGLNPILPMGSSAETPSASFASDWTFFQRDGLGDRGQAFAVHLANTPATTLVRAEIKGADSPFLYTLDQGSAQRESLWAIADPYQPTVYDGLRKILLSEQPLGWTWKAPLAPLLNLRAVDIDMKAGKGGANLKVVETLTAGDEGLAILSLNLYDLVDRAYKLGTYKVAKVTDAEGRSLPFHHRNDTLLVQLDHPQPAGQPFTLTFEYGGPILLRPGGDNYWELGVEPWFPQPEMDGQAYTVHAVVQTPKDDVPVAPGKTIRRVQGENGNLLEIRIDKPVQFFSMFAGAYSLTEETKDGLTIRVASYGNKGGGMQKRLIDIARQTIGFYEGLFEPFPFQEFNIIQVNALGFGQAPPGMMIITNEAFDAKMDVISSFFTKGINQRFAHEIAHQYWGHLVKMPTFEEQWVTESFANYASILALRSMKNQGVSAYEGLLSRWRNDASAYAESGTIPFANRLRWIDDPRASFMARTTLLYEKGALVLAALHKEMGDKTFAIFLKSLLANFRWKTLTTASVEQVATMAARKDFGPLFRDCYWGTQMPK